MTVKEILHATEEKMKKAFDSVAREMSEVRTGRASPGLVEGLHVDYYGTPTLLKQLASISTANSQLIVIQPWDVTAIVEIEKANEILQKKVVERTEDLTASNKEIEKKIIIIVLP